MKNRLLFFLIFTFSFSVAQQTNLKFLHLGIKDGLSQSEVLSILQDKKGLMWFGTQDGLNIFNGFEFKTYFHDLNDSLSISNSYIHQVYQDKNGIIWVATENGLNLFNHSDGTFQNVISKTVSNKAKNNVWSITENSTSIWAGIENQLIKIDKNTLEIETIPIVLTTNAKALKIRKISFTDDETLFIATEGNGFIKINTSNNEITHYFTENSGLLNNIVWDFYLQTSNKLWIATNQGICIYNQTNGKITSYQKLNKLIDFTIVKTLYEDKSGIVWIGTENDGLYKYQSLDNIDHYLYNATITTSLSSNKVNTIFEDNTGIIWIGTQSGVDKFDKQKQYFKHYQHWPNTSNTINSNMVWSIFQDDSSKPTLWIGTNKGLNIIDQNSGSLNYLVPDFSFDVDQQKNESVYSIFKDHLGIIYLGTDGGLFYFDNNQLKPLRYIKGQCKNRIYRIFEDRKGRLWLGTREGLGLVSADRKTVKMFISSNKEHKLKNDLIRTIIEDKKGTLWVGTDGGGLSKIIEENDSIYFKTYLNNPAYLNSLSHNSVLTMLYGNDNNIWIGTFGGGLNKFNSTTEEFSRFTEKDGLSNNVIYGIIEDNKGFLWLSTNKGISVFNKKTKQFINYEESDGLQSNEFNTGAYFISTQGEVFFGGVNGYNSFYPEDVHTNKSLPKPIITNFYLFNKPVKIGPKSILKKDISELDEITLKYKEIVISIEFA